VQIIESGIGELLQPYSMEEFREWNRKKPKAFIDKVMTEQEAISRFVQDGDYIAKELYGTVRAPMSLARELCRQGKKHLRAVGQGVLELDLWIEAGLIEAMDITYHGLEVYGISHALRRAAESGKLKLVEWSNGAITWRMKAAAMGVPFIPVKSMLGSDTLRYSSAKVVECPFTGEKVALLPAIVIDVGLIHAHRADRYGNAQIEGISGFAFEMARACKRLIVSAEEIVDSEEIRKYPDRTTIPYYLVDAVVHAPFGSHPGEMVYVYDRDTEHLRNYVEMSRTAETMKEYMDQYVYGVNNHKEYMELIGMERLEALKAACVGR
jgi:acyl CoA:acetate/3-ketoacid CoA transferase alpha subunit